MNTENTGIPTLMDENEIHIIDKSTLVQPNWLSRFMIGPFLSMQGQVQDVKSTQYYLTSARHLIVWHMAAFYKNFRDQY